MTVDSIVEAIAQVLRDVGFEAMTTKRVAERAGVSVGSLYQYFPSKEAMLVAVVDRHVEEVTSVVLRTMASAATGTLDELVHALVQAALAAHAVDPRLHRRLMDEVPRVGALPRVAEARARIREGCIELLAARDDVTTSDLEGDVFIVTTMVDAVAHAVVHERPDRIREGALEATLARAVRAALAPG